MRRQLRGAYYGHHSNRFKKPSATNNQSRNNPSNTTRLTNTSTPNSSRAPANQSPIVVAIGSGTESIWKLYMICEEYPPGAGTSQKINIFNNYITKCRSTFDFEKIDSTRSVPLDLQHLLNDSEFTEGWPSFKSDLIEYPEQTLRLLEFCLHDTLKCDKKINVRILNHQNEVQLSQLKNNCFGKLVTIKGTVIRVGSVGLLCTSMAFECQSCHSVQAVSQPQGNFTNPNICINCRSGTKFEPLLSSPFTITTDCQVTKVQEIQSQSTSGSIPRNVEIELHGNLVGSACPGDVLSVTGIVKVREESKGGEDGKRAARLLLLYIEAVSVHSHRNLSNPTLSFTLKDYYAIQEIHASENIFKLLVHSLCPSIFGHEMVKAGLILGLMGGREIDGGPRSYPHVLIVGDPGLGKSKLLQAATDAAPRGVYVCGPSASAGGLTVALGREAGGDFSLEAGALVLADKGVCCVDELDKMSAHHGSLLEAMEQRRVSVAKAGVVCSLAARATVLAAANPASGSYNKAKTVAENLKLNSALLSRFDLVFILLDKPDKKMDVMLSDHVLALRLGKEAKTSANNNDLFNSDTNSNVNTDPSLSNKLRLKHGEEIDTLPLVLLRKYIAYAKRYVHPKLTTEAADALKSFYLELRSRSEGGPPITTRQLEACIRLTQARAKVDLREEATVSDANDVINLMKHSLIDTFSDECGNIQLSRSINGSGLSSKNKLKRFLGALTLQARQLGKDVFTRKELLQIHKDAGVSGDANDLIEAMNAHCYLLLKASNTYQLIAM